MSAAGSNPASSAADPAGATRVSPTAWSFRSREQETRPMDAQSRAGTTYRLSVAHVIRLVAPLELLVGLAWIVTAILGMPRLWTLVLVALTVAIAGAGTLLFVRPPLVLALTDDGYRIGFARSPGRAAASWREVESVGTADVRGVRALVFALADGERSALPLTLLGARSVDAQREVHERLNAAFGYRKP